MQCCLNNVAPNISQTCQVTSGL